MDFPKIFARYFDKQRKSTQYDGNAESNKKLNEPKKKLNDAVNTGPIIPTYYIHVAIAILCHFTEAKLTRRSKKQYISKSKTKQCSATTISSVYRK